jgi:hypothetical protein
MSRKSLSIACLALFGALVPSEASLVVNIGGGNLVDAGGAPLAANTLIQLVNLGPDGIFNPINLADGSIDGLNQWVSGDDSVLNIPFKIVLGLNSVAGDFASTAGFDLEYQTDTTPGFLTRAFEFEATDLPAGLKLGVRWFPGLLASNLNSITLTNTQRYGEFTRQASPINQGVLWVTPADGSNISFDPLVTQSFGGTEPNSMGAANAIVPEPTAIGMSLVGAAGLAMLRRRRA